MPRRVTASTTSSSTSAPSWFNVTDDRQAAIQQVADFVQVDPALVVESPFALVGTPAEMIDDLLRRRERWGFTYVIVGAEDVESFAPVVAELAGH